MRSEDREKGPGEKVSLSIRLDKAVLTHFEKIARRDQTTVSSIINTACRAIMTDAEYYRQLAKHHRLKFEEYRIMQEQEEARNQCRT